VRLRSLNVNGSDRVPVVWVAHNFAFLGGSLGCAEGERITRAFEYAKEHDMPIIVQVCTGKSSLVSASAYYTSSLSRCSVKVEEPACKKALCR
jgi:hypothetical protein